MFLHVFFSTTIPLSFSTDSKRLQQFQKNNWAICICRFLNILNRHRVCISNGYISNVECILIMFNNNHRILPIIHPYSMTTSSYFLWRRPHIFVSYEKLGSFKRSGLGRCWLMITGDPIWWYSGETTQLGICHGCISIPNKDTLDITRPCLIWSLSLCSIIWTLRL
jgi:hypothetical protein